MKNNLRTFDSVIPTMNNRVTGRKHGITLPTELWQEIIAFSADVPGALDSDPGDALLVVDDTHDRMRSSVPTRFSLLLVSKQFHALSIGLFHKYISIWRPEQLWALAKSLDNFPDLSAILARCTRRLDVRIQGGFEPIESSRVTRTVARILSCCQKVSHFVCRLSNPLLYADATPLLRCAESCSGLKVWEWDIRSALELTAFLSAFPHLRILKLPRVEKSGLERVEPGGGTMAMSSLHTIHGPMNTLAEGFSKVLLPALTTLSLESDPWSDTDLRLREFVEAHVDKITSLVYELDPREFAAYHPLFTNGSHQIRDIVMDVLDLNIDTLSHTFGHLERIGLRCRKAAANPTSFCDYAFELLLGALGPTFPALTVVRIVDRDLSRALCGRSPRATRLWVRRFSGIGVRLENDRGDILLPPY